jgi:hypothetical protein
MPELEEMFATSLRRQAEPIDATTNLGARSYQLGRRLRTRRRITAVAACTAILAVGVPVGIGQLGGSSTEIGPVETPTPGPRRTPSPTPAGPAKPAKVSIDLDKLPAGAAPKVPWYADGVIHDGDRTVPIDVADDAAVQFAPVAGGYLVAAADPRSGQPKIRLVAGDGAVRHTVTGAFSLPAVSSDGRAIAYSELRGGDGGGEPSIDLVVVDTSTGAERARKHVDVHAAMVVGFLRGLLVFTGQSDDGGRTDLWNPETGQIRTVQGLGRAHGTNGVDLVLADTKVDPQTFEPRCAGIRDMAAGVMKAEICDQQVAGLLGDGRWVLAQSRNERGPLAVVDTASGRTLLEVTVTPELSRAPVTEPDGSLLLVVNQGNREAVVRCTLAGRCERATDVLPAPSEQGSFALATTLR